MIKYRVVLVFYGCNNTNMGLLKTTFELFFRGEYLKTEFSIG